MTNYPNDIEEYKKEKEIKMMRTYILRTWFTSKAKERLTNIKLVNKDKFNAILDMVVSMIKNKDLKSKITDNELKQFLIHINKKKSFNIRRK